MRVQPSFLTDGRTCHCGGRLIDGTNGDGRAIQHCNRCGARSYLLAIRPAALPPEPETGIVSAPERPCAGCGGVIVMGRFKYCPACATRDKRRERRRVRPPVRPCATPGCDAEVTGRFEYCAVCGDARDRTNRRSWRDRRHATRTQAAERAA